MKQQPNIIFIIADDHRSSTLGAHGCTEVATPALDALAAEGTDFTNAHCQGGFNPAVCVPSRASLLSGRSVFKLTPEDQRNCPDFSAGARIPDTMTTLPERLRDAGYATHAVGKWHNDKQSFVRGFSSAEHILFDGMSDHENMLLQDFDPEGQYQEERKRHVPGHSTELFRDATIRYLNANAEAQPFFLYVAFTAPHDPRTPPKQYTVEVNKVSLPSAYAPVHPFDNGETMIRDEQLASFPRSAHEVRQHLADYYGMVAHLDSAIGDIVATLRTTGLNENTVVVYTADHGLALGNHGLMGKQNLYEHSIGIPLIVSSPLLPAGQTREELVWHADTHATILKLAGLEVDKDCDGENLLPNIADDGVPPVRRYFGAAYRSSQRMIRDERYKLIRYWRSPSERENLMSPTEGARLDQLFDLLEDPNEQVNLVFLPELADVYKRLLHALAEWQRQHHDHLPTT